MSDLFFYTYINLILHLYTRLSTLPKQKVIPPKGWKLFEGTEGDVVSQGYTYFPHAALPFEITTTACSSE